MSFTQSYSAILKWLKTLFYHFLIVFFTNYTTPGIEVIRPTKWPHLGADLVFALSIAFINSLIFPVLKVVDQKISLSRIAIASALVAFSAYALLKFAPLGIEVKSVEGYIFASAIVALGCFLMNYYEMRRFYRFVKPPEPPRPSF
jgi:hypothetical protein